ncbi:MAG: hypothetical protein LBU11_12925 [Zoogloeaceae bacterium]|nr:hypothetical protein [Zoogloeaceae bacterium]
MNAVFAWKCRKTPPCWFYLAVGSRRSWRGVVDPGGDLPYSSVLRFLPKETGEARALSDCVWRYSANEAKARLAARRPDPRIAAQRETLGVWLPFTDHVVPFWLGTRDDSGRVAPASRAGGFADMPYGWKAEAVALLAEYERLRAQYTLCKKYHSPKETLGIMLMHCWTCRAAIQTTLGTRRRGTRRDVSWPNTAPGSERHRRLRAEQARIAGLPGYEMIVADVRFGNRESGGTARPDLA